MRFLRLFFIVLFSFESLISSEGKFVNPITDVCWECLFPITVGSPLGRVNLTPGFKDLSSYETAVCRCAGTPPKVGIPLTFWEPCRLVDVTRHAYKLLGLGGISIGDENIKNRGTVGLTGSGNTKHSFYHVHWYTYPLLAWLNFLSDFTCIEEEKYDVGYMSELDPLWNDDEWSAVLNPEAHIFSSLPAQLACIPDCTASSLDKPIDQLFWCAGCMGSLYPFSGSIAHHVGGIQASSLILYRIIAKLHRMGVLKGFPKEEFCEAKTLPIIKKSSYKTQLILPIPQTSGPCHALGKTDLFWGSGKSFPYSGEDFVYLIWKKKHCCLDAVKPSIKLYSGGNSE